MSQFKLALSPSSSIKHHQTVFTAPRAAFTYTFNQPGWKGARSLADCSPVSVNRVTVYTERKGERREKRGIGQVIRNYFLLPSHGRKNAGLGRSELWKGRCIPRSPAKNPIWPDDAFESGRNPETRSPRFQLTKPLPSLPPSIPRPGSHYANFLQISCRRV